MVVSRKDTTDWQWKFLSLVAALGAPLLTALAGLVLRRRVLPHGPAMCLATAVAVGCIGAVG